MRLSEGVEWGIHCTISLAGLPEGATLPTKALAENYGLSETYLAKHLQALANAKILESVPGPKGGYRLARPAEQITLLDIVEAIEGRERVFRCTEIRQRVPVQLPDSLYRMPCEVHVAMLRADRAWREALRSQTVAEIIANYKQRVAAQLRQPGEQWIAERIRHAPEKKERS
ncbi:BadM/Rrf2 family transcriptional regulator [Thermosporothrix hazakensis]|jgi:Rrf2 family protein|uniref:BadM/Rrf2 family transcriptional regulator n=2 Tax=Thermosporothrix TaxID=768650 RepID=A0A326U7Y2_THEHA|nr:Rrf2 family transcriptional regulator [Thermosporothrix hazakensis]PZW31178.1 BadM/Rrf2 family transcriptional regulator [Thermosporothrix hazakensis]BBH86602.1 Rrf2 family transcriptional regulator [Thermosporothrix sp. COM3]GCE50911.1 Rrf2 family transcriptional regulator [Thermosporothrix hazakensis]